MAKNQRKSGLIVTIVILAVVLIGVGITAFAINANKSTPPTSTDVSSDKSPDITKDAPSTDNDTESTPDKNEPTEVKKADPATLTSVAIEPLGITVFYTKGTPGFDFSIKRAANKTQYVEFTSTDLVGTKCTNDEGLIASIIKNPSSNEDQATISQTIKLGSDTYGLSLAGKGCTSNAALLDEYQSAFRDGFSSLSTM